MIQYRIGKIDVRELTIKAQKKIVDISKITTSIFLYEDIFSQHMSITLELIDGITLRSLFPIIGGETLNVILGEGSDGNSRELKGKFVVYKIANLRDQNTDTSIFTIHAMTPEEMKDPSQSVHRAYKAPIHETIQNIIAEYRPEKKLLEFEETEGIQNIIPTGVSPTAAIRMCLSEAASSAYRSSIFVLYEVVEGYKMHTLEWLYSRSPKHTFIQDEVRTSEANPNASQKLQHIIRHFNIDNSGADISEALVSGRHHTATLSFDPLTKTFVAKGEKGDINLRQDTIKDFLSDPTHARFTITDAHRDIGYILDRDENANAPRRKQDFMSRERSVLKSFTANRITVSISGDPNIIAGDTVDVIVPSLDDTEEGRIQNNELLSGKYLISAIAHRVMPTSGEYVSVVELIRPSYDKVIS